MTANDELRKRMAEQVEFVLSQTPEALAAENAKLRELVRHMYECMSNVDADGNHECFSCEYENTDGLCDYERLMRELGIGVDG